MDANMKGGITGEEPEPLNDEQKNASAQRWKAKGGGGAWRSRKTDRQSARETKMERTLN